jgi:hypothetical protein
MPTDACQLFYECTGCGTKLRPKAGHCCVFCSYGSVPCPPMQAENAKSCHYVITAENSRDRLTGTSSAIIHYRDMIDKVAHRLDEVGEMTGEQIDAVLLEG